MTDPYSVLGVQNKASQADIKAAYRKLAKKLHPDLNPGNKEVENKFKDVNRAYELVGTPEQREKFDRGEIGHDDSQPPPRGRQSYYQSQNGPEGGRYSQSYDNIDPSLFEDLFGGLGGFAGTGRGRSRGPRRGEDQSYSMEVEFNTAILGGEREITLPSGKKLRVKIPPGVKSGQKLRLSGQGEAGTAGSGDAYIEVQVAASPLFTRKDNDLEISLPLSLDEVLLGAEVRIPTIDGHVMLKVPAGLNPDSRLRIKGKGVPLSNGSRGDQYAVVKIVMPAIIDSELQSAIGEWKKSHSYNPRASWEKG